MADCVENCWTMACLASSVSWLPAADGATVGAVDPELMTGLEEGVGAGVLNAFCVKNNENK